jgi:hypothetical protein
MTVTDEQGRVVACATRSPSAPGNPEDGGALPGRQSAVHPRLRRPPGQPAESPGSDGFAFTTVGGPHPGISLAQAVTTDTKGINARDIELDVAGTKIPAYDARPEAPGRYPIVVAVSGFTGVNEHHRDVVRRFAHAGYYAIAPEPTIGKAGCRKSFEEMGKISEDHPPSTGDPAAADHARQQGRARAERLG